MNSLNPMPALSSYSGRHSAQRTLSRSLCVLALVCSAGAHAMGDPLVDELPWVRPGSQAPESTLTRADVRQALTMARRAGLLPVVGDTGHNSDMQAKRDALHARQSDPMQFAQNRVSTRRATGASAVAKELQAYVELRAAGAHPAMLRPSGDGTMFVDAEGREVLVVEIDD